MQVKKEEVKKKILAVAKNEFLENGYERASLREIAKKAKVTKGNIYTYFKSKDDLFSTIVKPALDAFMNELFVEYGEMDKENLIKEAYSIETSLEGFRYHVGIINGLRDEMQLLFFSSEGSSLAGYREEVAKLYEESSEKFYRAYEQFDPRFSNDVTYLFLHSCAQLYLGFVEEILLHDPKGDELDKYIVEMSTFISGGMKALLQIKR